MRQFMKPRPAPGAIVLAGAAFIAPISCGQGVDLLVGDITGSSAYVSAGSPKAYSLGIALCNTGSAPASFNAVSAAHPIITQNMYRLSNGRFEQIGQAWVQHLSSAVEQSLCSTCSPTGDPSRLGAGCSTVDTASAMGVQSSFGAKSEVNAADETFTWPRVNMGTGSGGAFKRLQVDIADLQPGPLYFVSSMVLSQEDGAAGHPLNNESYRRVTVGFAAPSEPLTMADTTQRGVPAIQAWKDNGLGVGVPDPDVMLTPVDVPSDGRFWIASKATDLGGGMWHYEYAVQNVSSVRCAAVFNVPILVGTSVTNLGFHGVAYHSGEPYSNAPWTGAALQDAVVWSTESYSQNVNANAIRWDTVYNFRFDASRGPQVYVVGLNLFTPGDPQGFTAAAYVPGIEGAQCGSADFDCDGDTGTDADIEAFFNCLAGACPQQPCANSADFNGDGDVGTDADIEAFFRVLGGGDC